MRVVITNTEWYIESYKFWYEIGEEYCVDEYRHNSKDYYEIKGWNGRNGISSNYEDKFWIKKEHCKEVIEQIELDEDLFIL